VIRQLRTGLAQDKESSPAKDRRSTAVPRDQRDRRTDGRQTLNVALSARRGQRNKHRMSGTANLYQLQSNGYQSNVGARMQSTRPK